MAQMLANYRKIFATLDGNPVVALIAEDASSNLPKDLQVLYTFLGGQLSWKRVDLIDVNEDGDRYRIDSSSNKPLHLIDAKEPFFATLRDAGLADTLRRTRPSITDDNTLSQAFEDGLSNIMIRDYPDVALAPDATHIRAESESSLPKGPASTRQSRTAPSGAARRSRRKLNIDVWSSIS